MQFPENPTHGMIFEASPGIFYQYNISLKTWTRVSSPSVPLASPLQDGLMSSDDYVKISKLIVPPPVTTLKTEDCGTFTSGLLDITGDDRGIINARVNEELLHENTGRIRIDLNIDRILSFLTNEGRIRHILEQGDPGPQGSPGENGLDALPVGPQGDDGEQGNNAPWPGELSEESFRTSSNSINIVDIAKETVNASENYLVVKTAHIGDPFACPNTMIPSDVQSPWALVLETNPNTNPVITRTTTASGLVCNWACNSELYYVDMESIIDEIDSNFNNYLAALKAQREDLAKQWLAALRKAFNEQKQALLCALEACRSRTRNENTRRYIEQQMISAAGSNFRLKIGKDEDKVYPPVADEDDSCGWNIAPSNHNPILLTDPTCNAVQEIVNACTNEEIVPTIDLPEPELLPPPPTPPAPNSPEPSDGDDAPPQPPAPSPSPSSTPGTSPQPPQQTTSDGWTEWNASKTLHVNDGDNIEAIFAQATPGTLILIKGGTTWDKLPIVPNGTTSAPVIIMGAPNSTRPKFKEGWDRFAGSINNIALVGLHIDTRLPLRLLANTNNLWIEDCMLENGAMNLILQTFNGSSINNVTLYRTIIKNAWNLSGHSSGAYIQGVRGLTIRQCVFDRNGWNPSMGANRTIFNHSIYLTHCHDVLIEDTLVSRGSSFGVLSRSDVVDGSSNYIIRNNVFYGNANCAVGSSDAQITYAFKGIKYQNNVFTRIGAVINNDAQSFGVIAGATDGLLIENNYWLDKPSMGASNCVDVRTTDSRALTIRNNHAMGWHSASFTPSGTNNIIQPTWYGPSLNDDQMVTAANRPRSVWIDYNKAYYNIMVDAAKVNNQATPPPPSEPEPAPEPAPEPDPEPAPAPGPDPAPSPDPSDTIVNQGDNINTIFESAKSGDTIWIARDTQWPRLPVPPNGVTVAAVPGSGPKPIFLDAWNVFGDRLIGGVTIRNLHFQSSVNTGMRILCNIDGLLFDGCEVQDFNFFGHSFAGSVLKNITMRKCFIYDRFHDGEGHISGMYWGDVINLLIEDSILDNNGHPSTVFRHNTYLNGCNNVTVRRSVFSRAGNIGIKMRNERPEHGHDHIIEDNVFVANGIAIVSGSETMSSNAFKNTVVRRNVATQSGARVGIQDQHMGIALQHTNGVTAENNYFIDSDHPGSSFTLRITQSTNVISRNNTAAGWRDPEFLPTGQNNTTVATWEGPKFDQSWVAARNMNAIMQWHASVIGS